MLIFPYSTALQLNRPPLVTYALAVLCVLVFLLQISSNVTESLMYYPQSWNPIKMITSSLAHGGWLHLIGNLLFFMAFAPALELLIGSKIKYIWITLFISFVVGISYSLSILVSSQEPLPSLGLSGVVTGMIGLSAYLMPHARIRVFWWYIFMWKTFYVPAWILAVIYIGLDAWTMFTAESYGGINVVAHVAGGVAGYLYGYFWLRERREDVRQELDEEIEAMKILQKHGKTRHQAYRYKKSTEQRDAQKEQARAQDKFLGQIYQMIRTHRDSEAIGLLLDNYNLETPTHELEALFERMQVWGPSRSLLCIGRLIIHKLDREHRDGRAIVYIDKCQQISPQFMLSDLSRVLHYAELAVQGGRLDVCKNLTANAGKRYAGLVNAEQCNHLFEMSVAPGRA